MRSFRLTCAVSHFSGIKRHREARLQPACVFRHADHRIPGASRSLIPGEAPITIPVMPINDRLFEMGGQVGSAR